VGKNIAQLDPGIFNEISSGIYLYVVVTSGVNGGEKYGKIREVIILH
jgi:hypothetical protein